MAPDDTQKGQRDGQHHDDRFDIAAALERQDEIDPDDPDQEASQDRGDGFGGIRGLACNLKGQPGAACGQIGQEPLGQLRGDRIGVADPAVHIGLHGDGAQPVAARDAGPAARLVHRDHGFQRRRGRAIGSAIVKSARSARASRSLSARAT